MVFFNKDNNGAAELQSLTGVYYAANSYELIASEIYDASREVVEIIGEGVARRAEQAYNSGTEAELVRAVQTPIACLAMSRYFRQTIISHEDTGRKLNDDYYVNYTIDWIDEENGIISVREATSFELLADSPNKFTYTLKTWARVSENSVYDNKIESFTVNSLKPTIKSEKNYVKDGCKYHEQDIVLHGETKYEISYVRIKKYSIYEDYYLGFCAKYIVNNLRVRLDLPSGVEAIFISRGTQEEFQDMSSTKNRIEKRYKKLILPQQGFVFALRKTN